jgi:hypothetical protein
VPVGFVPDNSLPNSFTEWESKQNDPYMAGWVVTNLSETKNVGNPGDVIISWFKPIDSTRDNPNRADDQLYFMVTNGFTGPDGTAADYRQQIQINFLATVQPTIERLNADTGQVEVLPLDIIPSSGGRRKLVIQLDGGEGALFKFNTGDPFVGVQPTGDFNADGVVDGADLLLYQRGQGTALPALGNEGDGNYDLRVDGQDLALWKSQYGGAPAASATAAAVPDPHAGLLALGGAAFAFKRRKALVR